jgi:iron complex outermembrane receptor protein
MALNYRAILLVSSACTAALIAAAPARAQQLDEVIVTARKRQESILNVPVIETAISGQKLDRLQTNDLKDVATMVPGLVLGSSVLSVGTQVSIRGIGTSALDPGVDAAVSLNVDGLQLSNGLAYTSALFDTGQVEVLKGPQSLFYGKTSPGGVISVRTADPTNRFELMLRGGQEFVANETAGEFIISGPVTDTLKLRFAATTYKSDGFYKNIAYGNPEWGGRDPAYNGVEPAKGYGMRLTALWNPTSKFDARLKVNQVKDTIIDPGTKQLLNCPDGEGPFTGGRYVGIPFMNANDGCARDRYVSVVDLQPSAYPGIIHNGTPYIDTTQTYGTLEMNYRIRPDLTLTSATGYYLVHNQALYNAAQSAGAGGLLAAENGYHRRQDSEELRLNSDFAGKFNFTAGAYFERTKFDNTFTGLGNITLGFPGLLQKGKKTVDGSANSVFGQVRYKFTPQVEVTAGLRWTDEKRNQYATNLITGTPVPINMPVPEIHASNFAPEVTITYKPTEDMTFFGALKQGYKSGSFNVGVSAPAAGEHNEFGDEKVQGGEVGMKSRWLDRRLQVNLGSYYYKYTGLQVSANAPTTGGIPQTRTLNAGSANVYGIEGDIVYQPEQIEGLNLNASFNWNHARYGSLEGVPCYGGQMISEGCNQQLNPVTKAYTAQDRSGLPLFRAPDFQTAFGFNWQKRIDDFNLVITNSTQFSTKYITNLGYIYYQPAFFKTDLSITVQGPKDRWEIALIGKDLNNALTSGNCSNGNNQAGLLSGFQNTGTNTRGPAGIDEVGCFMDRGREIWMRVTLRPFN